MIDIARFRMTLLVERGVVKLPEFAGATLRGALGYALKEASCTSKVECSSCQVGSSCAYRTVFEPHATSRDGDLRIDDAPRPFILWVPVQRGLALEAGDRFSFEVRILGSAISHSRIFVEALDAAARKGLGIERGESKVAVVEQWLDGGWRTMARTAGDGPWSRVGERCDVRLALERASRASPSGGQSIRMRLVSPVRLKFGGKVDLTLPFHVLVRNLARRASLLETLYGDGSVDVDYAGVVRDSVQVGRVRADMRWWQRRRVSSRQEQSISMSGLVGRIEYGASPEQWGHLVDLASVLHVGKGASFGMGRIEREL